MSGEPQYETAYELGKRVGYTDSVVCIDCGVFVLHKEAHTRFHAILSAHAWALAVLKTAHIGAPVHDRYEAYDKINSRKFDSWSYGKINSRKFDSWSAGRAGQDWGHSPVRHEGSGEGQGQRS